MHPDSQIKEYVRSLEKNGQLKLIVIDEDNTIWIGNGLYQAMMKAGWSEAKCLVKRGMTRQQKIKMMMALMTALSAASLMTQNLWLKPSMGATKS